MFIGFLKVNKHRQQNYSSGRFHANKSTWDRPGFVSEWIIRLTVGLSIIASESAPGELLVCVHNSDLPPAEGQKMKLWISYFLLKVSS